MTIFLPNFWQIIHPWLKDGVKEETKNWLNPLAKPLDGSAQPGSEAGSATSRATKSTEDGGGDSEEADLKTDLKSAEVAGGQTEGVDLVTKAEMEGVAWPVSEGERGKLLLEIYNGGTFKKSMNYHSFRESDKGRQSREISIDHLETDSLEISGSQVIILYPGAQIILYPGASSPSSLPRKPPGGRASRTSSPTSSTSSRWRRWARWRRSGTRPLQVIILYPGTQIILYPGKQIILYPLQTTTVRCPR